MDEQRRSRSRVVSGRMKSFDRTRGFGFMQTEAGETVMVHSSVLEELSPDWQAAVMIAGTEISGRLADRDGRPALSFVGHVEPPAMTDVTLKMFDQDRRFGFFSMQGQPDVHVSGSAFDRMGVQPVVGDAYRIVVGSSQEGSRLTTLHVDPPTAPIPAAEDAFEPSVEPGDGDHRTVHGLDGEVSYQNVESGYLGLGLGIGFVSRERRR